MEYKLTYKNAVLSTIDINYFNDDSFPSIYFHSFNPFHTTSVFLYEVISFFVAWVFSLLCFFLIYCIIFYRVIFI